MSLSLMSSMSAAPAIWAASAMQRRHKVIFIEVLLYLTWKKSNADDAPHLSFIIYNLSFPKKFPLTSTRDVVDTSLIVEKIYEKSRAFQAGNAGLVRVVAAGRF